MVWYAYVYQRIRSVNMLLGIGQLLPLANSSTGDWLAYAGNDRLESVCANVVMEHLSERDVAFC